MDPTAYTVARWRVAGGQEAAFRAAWVALMEALARLPAPPLHAILLQHQTDAALFYSFGPWDSADDIHTLCHDPDCQDAFLRVMDLCVDAEPGICRLVERIERASGQGAEASRPQRVSRGLRRSRPTTHP